MTVRDGQRAWTRRRLLIAAAAQAAWLMGCGDDVERSASPDAGFIPDDGDAPDVGAPDVPADAADIAELADTEDASETTELPDTTPVDPEIRAQLEAAIDAVAARAQAYFDQEALALVVPVAAAWLDDASDQAILATLTPTFGLLAEASCDLACLRQAVLEDFDAGDTDDVAGWTLGQTELALAAIATWDPRD